MTVSVDIADSVLDWIMSKVRPGSLPETVWKNLMQWSNKEKTPTFNQVEAASKATGIPLGYFFLQTPPQENLSLVDYRTVDSAELTNPSRELLDTIHDMELEYNRWLVQGVQKCGGFFQNSPHCDECHGCDCNDQWDCWKQHPPHIGHQRVSWLCDGGRDCPAYFY